MSTRVSVFSFHAEVIGMTLAKKVLKASCGNIDIAFQPRRVEMRLKKGQRFLSGTPLSRLDGLRQRPSMSKCRQDSISRWMGSHGY